MSQQALATERTKKLNAKLRLDFRANIAKLGLSQQATARWLLRDPSTVRRWLSGAQELPIEVAMLMSLMASLNAEPVTARMLVGLQWDEEPYHG